MRADHAYVPSGYGDCAVLDARGHHCYVLRADHPGESRLSDGPVRDTVDRQKERIENLEAELRQLPSLSYVKRLESGLCHYARLAERMEEVMYSRDLLRERLSNLDTLARQVSERITKMLSTLDR